MRAIKLMAILAIFCLSLVTVSGCTGNSAGTATPHASPTPGQQAGKGSTISGTILDRDLNHVTNASVSLWVAVLNTTTGRYDNIRLAEVAHNPQVTGDGPGFGAVGEYSFLAVPEGVYNVTATTNTGDWWFKIVTVNGTYNSSAPNDIVIPLYRAPMTPH